MALINFLIKIDKNHPKFHIRVMLPPKIKFKGFFYYLREIDEQLKLNRVFVYLFGDFTYKLFLKNSIDRLQTNIDTITNVGGQNITSYNDPFDIGGGE